MVNVVQYLIDERTVVERGGSWTLAEGVVDIESGVPENVKQLIEKQIERLSADERTRARGCKRRRHGVLLRRHRRRTG